jgi:hypothetical protein
MPVLFLAGEKDALLNTQKTAERLQKLVPDLTTHIVKEDGHAAINMAPQVVSYLSEKVRVETKWIPQLKYVNVTAKPLPMDDGPEAL